ncbi:cardiolipin synthase, partial [Candidatus Saccharibacteria bacterium]|nr:cardiolipin synthase [Candidatus Saccharibacteria bacterium]
LLLKTLASFRRNRKLGKLLKATVPEWYKSTAQLTQALGHMPVFDGNDVEILPEYDEVIQRIAIDIDAAEHFVLIEYFIIVQDELTQPIFDAIARATDRGVTVRVLYDSLSTRRYKHWRRTVKSLSRAGAHVQPMLPVRFFRKGYVRPDLRNHRKLVVVDGVTAYTGSLNLVRRDYHRKDDIYYDELVVRMRGPISLQLAAVFANDWHAETNEVLNDAPKDVLENSLRAFGHTKAQVLPSGPGHDDENNLKLFTNLVYKAQKKIVITNPYFVPDDALTTAIISAVRRGVEVVMINSEAIDQWMVGHAQRSFYQSLLEAGVKIYLYDAPILLHSKFMTVDGQLAAVGSSNLDIRSFTLNMEVTLVLYDPKVVKKLNDVERMYLSKSSQVQLGHWQKRPKRHQLLDNIARLTSALQ